MLHVKLTARVALLYAVHVSNTTYALLTTAPYSRITLGGTGGTKCARAVPPYTVGSGLEAVQCSDYHSGNDVGLRFVFDGNLIRLYADRELCVGSTSSRYGVIACHDSGGSIADGFKRWKVNPPRIETEFEDTNTYGWGLDRRGQQILFVRIYVTNKNHHWGKVDPTIKLLELDASNTCAEVPANHFSGGQIFAAECDLTNPNQRFIVHPNGALEVADGTKAPNGNGWCLDVYTSNTAQGAKWALHDCTSNLNQLFTFAGARIRWKHISTRVVGLDNPDAAKPLLGWYTDVADDFTKKWRPSLGEAQVMFTLENTNLCLDTSGGGQIKTAPCAVDPTETCSANPVDPAANGAQSFVLREGNTASAALVYADGSNKCATVSGSTLVPIDCNFEANQRFEISATGPFVKSKLNGQVFTSSNPIQLGAPTGLANQRWKMLPGRLPKCPYFCTTGHTCPTRGASVSSACYGRVCVSGMCDDDDAICCGADGIDTNCLNTRALEEDGLKEQSWCMMCTGQGTNGLKGLTGCSAPVAPRSDGFLPAVFTDTTNALTHVRCNYNNGNGGFNPVLSTGDINPDMEYLALTGAFVKFGTEKLLEAFPNLKHLDLAGSESPGFLFGEKAATWWTQLEHANVSTTTTLCTNGCFHTTLENMVSLRVLDMSHMGLGASSILNSLRTLESLEELYLNDNDLVNLPDNFFNNMLRLTKLRMRNNPMTATLPPVIYTRNTPFDCDVPPNVSPFDARTSSPTSSSPTGSPTAQPSTAPTAPTMYPSAAPTAPTLSPSESPSTSPTFTPTFAPSNFPTMTPTLSPTTEPTTTPAKSDDQLIVIIGGASAGLLMLVVVIVVLMRKRRKAGGSEGASTPMQGSFVASVGPKGVDTENPLFSIRSP
jgi:hypothetical protein